MQILYSKNGKHALRLIDEIKDILRKNQVVGIGSLPFVAANNIRGILTDISRGFNAPGLDFSKAFNENIPIANQLFMAAQFAIAGSREPGRLTQLDVDNAIKGKEFYGSSLTAIAGLEGATKEVISRMGDAADVMLNGFTLTIAPSDNSAVMRHSQRNTLPTHYL